MKKELIIISNFFFLQIFSSEITNILKQLTLNCQAACHLYCNKTKQKKLTLLNGKLFNLECNLEELTNYLTAKKIPQIVNGQETDDYLDMLNEEWKQLIVEYHKELIKVTDLNEQHLFNQRFFLIQSIRKFEFLASQDEVLKEFDKQPKLGTNEFKENPEFKEDFTDRFKDLLKNNNLAEALICASKFGYSQGVKDLLKKHFFNEAVLGKALYLAVCFEHSYCVELLLKNKANPDFHCIVGPKYFETPLMKAQSLDNESMIKLLSNS